MPGQQDYRRGSGGDSHGPGASGGIHAVREALKSTEHAEYFDGNGGILPALLDAGAQKTAQDLAEIPTTQIRRFFGQVSAIKRRLEMDRDKAITEGEIQAQLAFLKASTAYAAGRDGKNLPVLRFMVRHANTVRTRDDFSAFHRHFETVVAFHKVYGKDSEKKHD